MAITAQILRSLNQMFITVVFLVAGGAASFLQFRQVVLIGIGMRGDLLVTIDTGRVAYLDKRLLMALIAFAAPCVRATVALKLRFGFWSSVASR